MTDVIYKNTDNVYRLDGLKNSQTGAYVNDASVQLILKDESDNEISGITWPLTLDYIVDSDGSYQASISDTLDLDEIDSGTAYIEIDGDGLQTTLELPVSFEIRGAATLAWTSRTELYNMFGQTNVRHWADLENDSADADIDERINWAVDEATEDARARLTDSPVDLPNIGNAPRVLRIAVTRLAGVLLYESRGVKDTASEDGTHRLTYHKKEADKFFRRVQAGVLRIDTGSTSYPVVQTNDEDDDDLSDLSTGQEVFL